MTEDQALTIIARMVSAWPATEITEPTVEIWREHLLPKRFPLMLEVVKGLEQSSKWFPSMAEVADGYNLALKHEDLERRHLALDPGPVRWIPHEKLTELIQSMPKRIHSHRQGPDECPTCGPVRRCEPGYHVGPTPEPPPGECPECAREMGVA